MVVEKDIVAISIPFTAGVAMAAVWPPGGISPFWIAGGSCVGVSLLLFAYGRLRPYTGTVLALFWLLGVFAFNSDSLVFPAGRPAWPPAQRALAALLRAIDAGGLPHPETGALLKALLAGQRGGLDPETVRIFREAGASHLLALSGLHLGLLYGILQRLLSPLGHSRPAQLLRSAACVGASFFYLLMTGAAPSLVRAFLFICFNELSRLMPGRRRRPLNIFCAALVLQLTLTPDVIRNVGFQLSYLAMLGIQLVYPVLSSWYPPSSPRDPVRRLWNTLALTLSCQLFTAPLAWLRFGTFPRCFLLTNLGGLPLTEAFLLTALPTLLPGCPDGIKNLADYFGQALLSFLGTVASIA